MTVALAVTWNPRGELPRFRRLLPRLDEIYGDIVIYFAPQVDPEVVGCFTQGEFSDRANIRIITRPEWTFGRTLVLQKALETTATHIHYADMDRLLRWVETRPAELVRTVAVLQETDCLLVGRTAEAYRTHPQSLIQTEKISNQVVSYLLGREVDVSAGSKGFSRQAVEWIVSQADFCHSIGTDAEWPLLMSRAGFRMDYVEVDGLDWETADRYREQAAGPELQRQLAETVDQDAQEWRQRVEIARIIVACALGLVSKSGGKPD